MDIKELISNEKVRVVRIVRDCRVDAHTVIARYTAAIAVNFTDWIGKTIPWTRHQRACYSLIDNLRCEAEEDHVGMLLRFAELSKALPDRYDYIHTHAEVTAIRRLLAHPVTAGLSGVTLCAVLENTSEIFIPDLARRAEVCGCRDLTYVNVHGEADIAHSQAFIEALEAERTMGYENPDGIIHQAVSTAMDLIARIYSN